MNKPMPIAFETAETTYYITQQVGRLKHLTARPRDKKLDGWFRTTSFQQAAWCRAEEEAGRMERRVIDGHIYWRKIQPQQIEKKVKKWL